MKLQGALLKKREIVGNMYVYTYVYPRTKQEVKVAKLIPVIKELVVEGDNNHIIVPVVPEKVVIKGSNNTVEVREEDELVIPSFMEKKTKKPSFAEFVELFIKNKKDK